MLRLPVLRRFFAAIMAATRVETLEVSFCFFRIDLFFLLVMESSLLPILFVKIQNPKLNELRYGPPMLQKNTKAVSAVVLCKCRDGTLGWVGRSDIRGEDRVCFGHLAQLKKNVL